MEENIMGNYENINALVNNIEVLEKNKVKFNTQKIINKLSQSDYYEYKELIKQIESDCDYFYFENKSNDYDLGISRVRFYLNLIDFTRNKNNDTDVIIKLFVSSINMMNNLSRLRDRNHVLVEIVQSLLNTKDDFDKSNLIRKILNIIEKIFKENNSDINWIVEEVKNILIKNGYKKFSEELIYLSLNNRIVTGTFFKKFFNKK